LSADPTSSARPAVPSHERRARLAWQLWLDGEVRFAPIALAGGSIVVLDRPEPTRTSHVRRVDDDGAKVWETALPFGVCAGPARSEGFIAVPCQGGHVVILDVQTGAIQGRPVSGNGEIVPPIAALGGRLWVRFAGRPGLPHRLVVRSLQREHERLEVEDPLGSAIETHFRRTNHTIVATAEHSDGHVVLVGLDEAHASLLWRTRLEVKGVSDLWGAGGLIDLVCNDRVMSFDARSGTPLTTRFSGMNLEGARLCGETLLVLTNGHAAPVGGPEDGAKPSAKRHLVSAFECANETPRGTLDGVQRVVAAGSDLLAVHLVDGPFALLELPDLTRVALPESDALEDVTHAAFSWNRAWIVGHRGQSLSALDLPL